MRLDISKIKFRNVDIKRELILPEKLTPELAEEIGLHIGDGTMNNYFNKSRYIGKYSLRGHIIDDVNHYDSRIKTLYKELYNLDFNMCKMESTRVYGFQIWSDGIVNFKHKILKLPLGYKTNIKIPKFLINKDDMMVNIIRGIFDTDGCVYLEPRKNGLYPRLQIGTISKFLAEQLKKGLIKVGLRATIVVENRENKGWSNFYVVYVRGDNMIKKWMEIISPANKKHIDKFHFYMNNS